MVGRTKEGFGLIELMLVIAIIGILAGLILSAASQGRLKARDTAIENAIRQIRWQAEIAYTSNNNSYLNWTTYPLIQDELVILLGEVDKHYGDENPLSVVTQMRDSDVQTFCASAPARAEVGSFYCIDAGGKIGITNAHCPSVAPFVCP